MSFDISEYTVDGGNFSPVTCPVMAAIEKIRGGNDLDEMTEAEIALSIVGGNDEVILDDQLYEYNIKVLTLARAELADKPLPDLFAGLRGRSNEEICMEKLLAGQTMAALTAQTAALCRLIRRIESFIIQSLAISGCVGTMVLPGIILPSVEGPFEGQFEGHLEPIVETLTVIGDYSKKLNINSLIRKTVPPPACPTAVLPVWTPLEGTFGEGGLTAEKIIVDEAIRRERDIRSLIDSTHCLFAWVASLIHRD